MEIRRDLAGGLGTLHAGFVRVETVRLEARTMRLLMCLAERAGQIVSIEELLDEAWAGVIVSPDSVYQGIATLRRHLADDPKEPSYIATVPRLGYRMVARVAPWVGDAAIITTPSGDPAEPQDVMSSIDQPSVNRRRRYVASSVIVVVMLAAAVLLTRNWLTIRALAAGSFDSAPAGSVAVLPFVDLTTEEMNEEYFADGITEELIGDLSRYPGLRVPAPTASFYFKGKQRAIADVARQLGVAYVLDGSVRKSGSQYRVAMRLVRADNGYVVYTETYEKPLGDLLSIQKNIAAEAAISIRNAIERADHGASWNVLIGSGQRVG
jgi:TolB-like protein/DNA-binding winged helix-turn-helix (wHTH) protein